MVCRSESIATEATCADCTQAQGLIVDIPAQHLIADKGCDSDIIVEQARSQGMQAVIPPRKNRKEQREYDKHLYRQRHLVENAFLALKQWRGRYPLRQEPLFLPCSCSGPLPRSLVKNLMTTLSSNLVVDKTKDNDFMKLIMPHSIDKLIFN